jgi:predicted phosphate transport protein (TIGR00153 family)
MRFLPREMLFFDLLEQHADNVVAGAKMLEGCLESARSMDDMYLASKRIHEVEHQGDEYTHRILERLNKTFITPLDREDIFDLTSRLDDVLDYIDAVAKRLVTFRISHPTAYSIELSRIVHTSSVEVAAGVRLLRDLRKSDAILKVCAKINQYENEADQVMRDALHDLFDGQKPMEPIEVIKWKDLYEHLEIATDKCEDVANVFESVLVKYS